MNKTLRVGDAGHTIFGPPNGKPSPETIASVKTGDDARELVRRWNEFDSLKAENARLRKALESALEWFGELTVDDGAESLKAEMRQALSGKSE